MKIPLRQRLGEERTVEGRYIAMGIRGVAQTIGAVDAGRRGIMSMWSENGSPSNRAESHDGGAFLPDFCNIRTVFAVVVMAELLAFILALAAATSPADRWSHLSLVSLFVQWIALSATALLCLARRWLVRLDTVWTSAISFVLIQLVCAILSAVVYVFGGETGLRYIISGPTDFMVRNLMVSTLLSAALLRYYYVQYEWKRNIQAEASARLQALQARIRPHFMFNSMNTIASLARSQPALAEAVVEDLADLFRVSLSDAAGLVTLEEELAMTRRYLRIEQLRLGERLLVDWAVADDVAPTQVRLPALTIQPLVENAVYHGIEPLPDGGTVAIHAQMVDDGAVRVDVSNPVAERLPSQRRRSNHMAVDNVRERLALHFGAAAHLDLEAHDGTFHASLVLPGTGEAR